MGMNHNWSLTESTEKGEECGLISSVSNDELNLIESEGDDWVYARDETVFARHFQEKFTYYTFAKAMEKLSMGTEQVDPDFHSQQGQSSANASGVPMVNTKGTHYHVRRSHRTPKSRSNRVRDRRSEGDNHDITDRSVKSSRTIRSVNSPPLLEISEEVYAVRQAALTVMEPLTYGWVSSPIHFIHLSNDISPHIFPCINNTSLDLKLIMMVGCCISAELATAYFLNLLPHFRYWFIFLPCWMAHGGIFICHVLSFRALSIFISDANENRQREDTTDPFDRTEYLPILQRSLKFSLKMGMISGSMLVFEILIYIRIARESISLSRMLTPVWVIATMGILNGIVCKTQHIVSLFSWILLFVFMMLLILRVDYGFTLIGANAIVTPLMVLLSLVTCIWLYILYGHKVGYFRLTRWQLKAGILYSLGTVISLVSIMLLVNWWSNYPFDAGMRLFMCILTPLIVALVGFGAWSVNRDEFERLLRFGGQAAVHPMKLRFERNGWTAVEGIGVVSVPMLGDIEYVDHFNYATLRNN